MGQALKWDGAEFKQQKVPYLVGLVFPNRTVESKWSWVPAVLSVKALPTGQAVGAALVGGFLFTGVAYVLTGMIRGNRLLQLSEGTRPYVALAAGCGIVLWAAASKTWVGREEMWRENIKTMVKLLEQGAVKEQLKQHGYESEAQLKLHYGKLSSTYPALREDLLQLYPSEDTGGWNDVVTD